MAELAARYAGRQAVVADGDLLIDILIRKVVGALGHGTNKDADALVLAQAVDVLAHPHNRGVEAERDFAAVGRQMVRDGVLDHLQELFLRVGALDGQTVEKLDHETSEALEGTGDTDGRRDLDQDTLGGLDVNLQPSGLVDGRIEKREEALEDKRRRVSVAMSAC